MQQYSEIAQNLDRFMRKLHMRLHQRAAAVEDLRVPPGVIILLTLADNQPMSMQELAARTARDKSQISRLVRDLEDKGLVLRAAHPDDARVNLLCLTADGTALLARMQQIMTSQVADLLAPLDESERTALAAILNKL